MEKIVSKERHKSKERFNQLLIGLVFIFLMILSTFGYSLSTSDKEEQGNKKVVYNGYEFLNSNGFWRMSIQDMQFTFRYNPKEVYRIPGKINDLNSYYDLPLYIQSENSESSSEIYMNLNQLVQRIQPACLNNSNCTGNYPTKDCNSNFIIIKESNITGIEQNSSCVFIQGTEEDMLKVVDEFLFKIMGIEEE